MRPNIETRAVVDLDYSKEPPAWEQDYALHGLHGSNSIVVFMVFRIFRIFMIFMIFKTLHPSPYSVEGL